MALRLVFAPADLDAAARLYVDRVVAYLRSGRDATGRPLPPGTDLRDTGRLLSDVRSWVEGEALHGAFAAPYAVHVNKRTPIAGLPPEEMRALMVEIGGILARGVKVEAT